MLARSQEKRAFKGEKGFLVLRGEDQGRSGSDLDNRHFSLSRIKTQKYHGTPPPLELE